MSDDQVPGCWAQRVSLALAVAVFVAGVLLVIASITAI